MEPLEQVDLARRALLMGAAGLAGVRAAAAEAGYEWRPWPAGRRVPTLDLPRLDGGRWRLADQRGKVVLANFWATWCVPCRDEMPSLQQLAQQRSGQGLVVVTVNYQEAPATIRRFTAALPLALPVLLDSDGAAAKAWTPRIFPTTLVFDRRGRPRGALVGQFDWGGPAAGDLLSPLLNSR